MSSGEYIPPAEIIEVLLRRNAEQAEVITELVDYVGVLTLDALKREMGVVDAGDVQDLTG